jgi:hypothetical protein
MILPPLLLLADHRRLGIAEQLRRAVARFVDLAPLLRRQRVSRLGFVLMPPR